MTTRAHAGLPAGHVLRTVRRVGLAIGLAGTIACLVAGRLDPAGTLESWLVAWLYVAEIALGCLAVLLIHHVTGGAWGVVVRRPLECGALTIPLLALLFVPIAAGAPLLYHWAAPHALEHDALLRHKALYLNLPFFYVRAVLYFGVWTTFAALLARWSLAQDAADPTASPRLHALARGGLVATGLTMTFASIDWGMSLEPHWFSTIYGMMFMVGAALSGFAFVIPVGVALRTTPLYARTASVDEFHDLGKLLLAFIMLWAYMALSQFLIIWSGNLPDETPWYLARSGGGWKAVTIVLVVFHLAVPFFVLLSRRLKRRPGQLAGVALALLAMRWLDVLWLIRPAASPGVFDVRLLDVAATAGILGLWVAAFVRLLETRPVLPLRDPSLPAVLEVTT
jgi:hypothetical protein